MGGRRRPWWSLNGFVQGGHGGHDCRTEQAFGLMEGLTTIELNGAVYGGSNWECGPFDVGTKS